jgi:hypothetical protein
VTDSDRGIGYTRTAADSKNIVGVNEELTEMMREIVSSLYAFMFQIDERIKAFDRRIAEIFRSSKPATFVRGLLKSEVSGRRRQPR